MARRSLRHRAMSAETVLGAMIFSVIISGFTSIRLDAYYQEMVKGVIIVGAVVLDQWRQRMRALRA